MKVAEAVIKAALETGVAGRERLAVGKDHSNAQFVWKNSENSGRD
jgi:hypothetical protein